MLFCFSINRNSVPTRTFSFHFHLHANQTPGSLNLYFVSQINQKSPDKCSWPLNMQEKVWRERAGTREPSPGVSKLYQTETLNTVSIGRKLHYSIMEVFSNWSDFHFFILKCHFFTFCVVWLSFLAIFGPKQTSNETKPKLANMIPCAIPHNRWSVPDRHVRDRLPELIFSVSPLFIAFMAISWSTSTWTQVPKIRPLTVLLIYLVYIFWSLLHILTTDLLWQFLL